MKTVPLSGNPRTRKEWTVSQNQSKDPDKYVEKKVTQAASEEKSDDVKCDNHPDRKARVFDGGGGFRVNFCDECTPPWFKTEDSAG